MRIVLLFLVACFVPSPGLIAQAPTTLPPGTRVRININQDVIAAGQFVSLRGDTIVLADSVRSGRRERSFALGPGATLFRFDGRRGHARKGALVGGAVGFALGVIAVGTSSDGSGTGSTSSVQEALAGGCLVAVPFALFGAAIGSVHTDVWTRVDTRGLTALAGVILGRLAVVRTGIALHWEF